MEFASSDENLVSKWISGCKLDTEDKVFTYFFLDELTQLKIPLKKDSKIQVGRGKNWIEAQIPPNRCVTFDEFVRYM